MMTYEEMSQLRKNMYLMISPKYIKLGSSLVMKIIEDHEDFHLAHTRDIISWARDTVNKYYSLDPFVRPVLGEIKSYASGTAFEYIVRGIMNDIRENGTIMNSLEDRDFVKLRLLIPQEVGRYTLIIAGYDEKYSFDFDLGIIYGKHGKYTPDGYITGYQQLPSETNLKMKYDASDLAENAKIKLRRFASKYLPTRLTQKIGREIGKRYNKLVSNSPPNSTLPSNSPPTPVVPVPLTVREKFGNIYDKLVSKSPPTPTPSTPSPSVVPVPLTKRTRTKTRTMKRSMKTRQEQRKRNRKSVRK